MTMGPGIVQRQNTDDNIRRLSAQRKMYSAAKRFFGLQIFLTTLLVVLITGLNAFLSLQIDDAIAIYCVLITLLDVGFLNDHISNLKERAASVQESFDTDVLDIQWNPLVTPVSHEVVYRYSEKNKRKTEL